MKLLDLSEFSMYATSTINSMCGLNRQQEQALINESVQFIEFLCNKDQTIFRI